MAKCSGALVLAVALVVLMMVSDSALAARNMQQMSTNSKAANVVDATKKSPKGGDGLSDNKNFGFGGVGAGVGGATGLVGPFGGIVGGAGMGGGVGTVFPVGGVVGGGAGGVGGGVGGIVP